MENQICLNGQTIDLSTNQLAQIKRILAEPERRLSALAAGETCKIGNHEFVVLEQLGDTAAMIRKELLVEESDFGYNNNFSGSTVDKICAKFAVEFGGLVGEENLVTHTVDLTSDDGLKDYGAWKNHALHGNCRNLIWTMDQKVNAILKKEDAY